MIDGDILKTIATIESEMISKYIPVDDMASYLSGDISIQDYMDFDTLEYYKEVQKMKVYVAGISATLKNLPPQNSRPVNVTPQSINQQVYIDVLDDNEFADQGYSMPVQDISNRYKYHEIKTGETIAQIAEKYYGDMASAKYIIEENGLYQNDLIDKNMAGVLIKIPILDATQYSLRSNDNLVFEKFADATAAEYQQYLLGSDLDLISGKIGVSANGDIAALGGVDCVIQNLQDRFSHVKGSLNPANPDWGMMRMNDYSNLPYIIAVEKFLQDAESQALADPRVVSATVLRDQVRVEGDVIRYTIDIKMIGNIPGKIEGQVM